MSSGSNEGKSRQLEGKVALVTGASRGIGAAIARRLASEGAWVAVHYSSDEASARKVQSEIGAVGGRAFCVQANLATLPGVEQLFEHLDRILADVCGGSGFDILVNNAGIAMPGTVDSSSEAIFDQLFDVNVKAPFFVAQKAIPRLREGGRIINISSVVARLAFPSIAAYSMTKGALNTLSVLLAKELGPRRITVNALAPGVIDTSMNAQMLATPEGRSFASGLSVFNRVGTPEDVADIAAFLASEDSRWITGQCIDASGGTLIG